MTEKYDVAIKVMTQKGTCTAGHKVGDEWVIRGKDNKAPEGICLPALTALYPFVRPLMFGASFSWANTPDSAQVACPDADNPVVFELRRLQNK